MKLLHLIVAIVLFLDCVQSAKILATVFTPSYSHQVAFRPLWRELLKRGHTITLLTTDPMKDPDLTNLKEIDLSGSYGIMESHGTSKLISDRKSTGKSYKQVFDMYITALSKTAEWQLEQSQVKTIIRNRSEYFDLIITEVMFPTHLGFVDRFNAPFIGITSLDATPRVHASVGNFMHPVLYPDNMLNFSRNLTFLQRLISVLFTFWIRIYEYSVYRDENETAKKHFGKNIRPLEEIEKDMSFLFINVNPIFHNVRPIGPNTIQIGGGIHLKEPQPLPQDLQHFMDSAEKGVIYLSFGTNVKGSLLNSEFRSVLLEVLGSLPYKVVWKFEEENLPNKPDNMKIMKWVPQQDLFRHPKVVLFITQCGLQSMEESIFHHVPMVGIPFFGDQSSNSEALEAKGLGIAINSLKRANLTKEEFQQAVLEVINNPVYRNNIIETSELMRDVEMDGLQTAVWWTEYTLRTNGAKHLRNPVVDLPLYKYFLLDVIGFVLVVSVIFLYLFTKTVKFVTKLTCWRRRSKKNKSE